MNKLPIIFFMLLSTFIFSQGNAGLQGKQPIRGTLSFDIAQDWFVDWWPNKNFDRNYTQGTSLSYSRPDLHKSVLFTPLKRPLSYSK